MHYYISVRFDYSSSKTYTYEIDEVSFHLLNKFRLYGEFSCAKIINESGYNYKDATVLIDDCFSSPSLKLNTKIKKIKRLYDPYNDLTIDCIYNETKQKQIFRIMKGR